MDILKNFLFPKIDFKRDIIRGKIWFPYGKRLLANNMTGLGDVRLCKWGGGQRVVKWMYQALFFSPLHRKKQRSKKKKTPDLRLLCFRLRRQSVFHYIVSDGVISGVGRKWKRSDSSDTDPFGVKPSLKTLLRTRIFDFGLVISALTTRLRLPLKQRHDWKQSCA